MGIRLKLLENLHLKQVNFELEIASNKNYLLHIEGSSYYFNLISDLRSDTGVSIKNVV